MSITSSQPNLNATRKAIKEEMQGISPPTCLRLGAEATGLVQITAVDSCKLVVSNDCAKVGRHSAILGLLGSGCNVRTLDGSSESGRLAVVIHSIEAESVITLLLLLFVDEEVTAVGTDTLDSYRLAVNNKFVKCVIDDDI